MSIQAISENEVIDLDTPDSTASDTSTKRKWWSFFNRSEAPSTPWFGRRLRNRDAFLHEFREERERLLESIEQLTDRIETAEANTKPVLTLDPMPVMKGIESLSSGQKEVSSAIQSLSGMMERADLTDQQLVSAMSEVNKTLSGVRTTQTETVGALVNVGEKIDDATFRFEDLFERMSKAEQTMAQDYRRLQHRTLFALALIAAFVVVVLCFFMAAPWA